MTGDPKMKHEDKCINNVINTNNKVAEKNYNMSSDVEYQDAIDIYNRISTQLSQSSFQGNQDLETQNQDPSFDLTEFLAGRILTNKSSLLTKLGVTLKNVSVYVTKETENEKITNLLNFFVKLKDYVFSTIKGNTVNKETCILHNITTFVTEGEMMLVLGKPESGCTTLLKLIGNITEEYSRMDGEISYTGISPKEMNRRFKGEIMYNQEEDVHHPCLTVEQTLRFAIKTKIPRNSQSYSKDLENNILKMTLKIFGLEKCKNTKVGDAFIRGISGGEKKRLSIAEQIAMGGILGAWDGSTKGLDSSSAFQYIKSLRIFTDILMKTTIVTLYQVSEDIFNMFDKILLLYDGRCIYFGDKSFAKQYFLDLGFECPKRCTTADFLTMITDPQLVQYNKDFDLKKIPKTNIELENAYRKSDVYSHIAKELDNYNKTVKDLNLGQQFRETTIKEKGYKNSEAKISQIINGPYTTSWSNQFKACVNREFQLWLGNRVNFYSHIILTILMSFIMGFAFYQLPLDSTGAFTRTGALYSAILINTIISISELYKSINGRAIYTKQKAFAMYSNSAYYLSQVISDFPVFILQTLLFSCIYYWIVGFDKAVSSFLTFVFVLLLSTLCTSSLYRILATISPDVSIANLYLNVVLMTVLLYLGYLIPPNDMKSWLYWIYYTNYLSYSLAALFGNEFKNISFECTSNDIKPNGPEYNDFKFQTCSIKGSIAGERIIEGADYIKNSFGVNATLSNVWINILILFCFWIFFIFMVIILMNFFQFGKSGYTKKVFKRKTKKVNRYIQNKPKSFEIVRNDKYFWFHDINYYAGNKNELKLLNNINGYIKPGSFVALMGASGAGKTTLLNLLAFRNDKGKREGDIYLGNKKFNLKSSKQIGFCQQIDIHNPCSTVKEALKFSAYLRQSSDKSKQELDQYVDDIIGLLEIKDIEDAMIGIPESGIGISLEARKKLSIGIELVAQPEILFLDEPTSGLDSHASLIIIKFLKKLADNGQTILCTIHQPSSILFEHFTDLILLGKEGKVVYFGEIGQKCQTVIHYFERNNSPHFDEKVNPPEHILEISQSKTKDWHEIWQGSLENRSILNMITDFRSDVIHNKIEFVKNKNNPSFFTQLNIVLSRMFRSYWRSPTYNLSRFFNHINVPFIIGITFFQLENSLHEFQNRVFAVYQVVVLGILSIIGVQPQYFTQRMWFEREYKSGFYTPKIFSISMILVEIPYTILAGLVFFVIIYYFVGFSTNILKTLYFVVLYIIFQLYETSFGLVLANFTDSMIMLPIINCLFTVNMALLSGVSIPYNTMNKLYKYLYWLNPYHYAIEGFVSNEITKLEIKCLPDELLYFKIPNNTTCLEYASAFMKKSLGYIVDQSGESKCGYCLYRNGDDYLTTLNWSALNKWLDLLVVLGFWALNIILIFAFIQYKYRK